MRYPTLNTQNTEREIVDEFRGYNHNLRIGDGEFYDMKNMTSSYYPVLSPRGKRGVYASPTSPQGMIAKDTLCYVDGSEFVFDQYRIDMGLSTEAEDCPKTMVSMGAYVIILPDKKYINTADIADYGNIEASVTTSSATTFSICDISSTDLDISYTGASAPAEPSNMEYWLDTSSSPHTLKQWSEVSGVWVSIATTYIKISSPGIGASFEKYDGVNITGLKGVELIDNNGNVVYEDGISALDGYFVIWDKSDDYIVVVGILDNTRTLSNVITVERKMPNMDFVIESENRLWGCRYGTALNGDVVNEIYACKLGDFKNWNCFMGISTDSYAASVGTDGQFTGTIAHLGYPLFFKETCLHKVYGNYPSNYQIQTTACRGVQRGCAKSLAIVNEVLYYKARTGVCAYDGSLPTEISTALGDEIYSDAVAGSHGSKYYVSMKDDSAVYQLFVYDAQRGLWHREDNTQVDAFCSCREEMYYIDHKTHKIMTMLGGGTIAEDEVDWMVETGVIGTSSPDYKYVSRLLVRMSLAFGSKVRFYAEYDSSGDWEFISTMTGTSLRSFSVPIRPRRCDHFRLRIVGEGNGKIFSITKTIEEGSDI